MIINDISYTLVIFSFSSYCLCCFLTLLDSTTSPTSFRLNIIKAITISSASHRPSRMIWRPN
ncbi:hypothetical protein K445DRAFT_153391 [Daldinia sp. EC12]|nr:hypothetical protein K445DRAFT_153391 [Daldinia sp. EC12]